MPTGSGCSRFFTGRRPRRTITGRQLAGWGAEAAGIPDWLFRECYFATGDFAEAIALLLPAPKAPVERSLADWVVRIRDMARLDEQARREALVAAWDELAPGERFAFHKLLTGGMRVGVSQGLIIRALAKAFDLDRAVAAHRIMGNWHPDDTTFDQLVMQPHGDEDASRPYPFFLAHALEQDPESLGSAGDWQAEWKWDGIRGQLIRRGEGTWLWSRGEELVTPSYPEIALIGAKLPPGTVLDGEILPWRDGSPLPFQILQTRVGRKKVSRAAVTKAPVAFMVYDVLEWEGHDLRGAPMVERRARLEALVPPASSALLRSETIAFADWAELRRIRETSRERGSEGIMLKRLDSPYGTGRQRGAWWKWKIDPYTVDAVMVYAQPGHGRRANLYTDYTFAVWKGDELVTFTKAYSGLSDAEIREVDTWVRRNSLDRHGPVRVVKPELVFEIAFEGIARSSRHKSGIALRFPRMHRWRRDKPAAEADRFEDLERLLRSTERGRDLPQTGSLFD